MSNDPIIKAYNFFVECPGHLKTATSDIANRLGVSYQSVVKGRNMYRDKKAQGVGEVKKFTNAAAGQMTDIEQDEQLYQSFQEFLEENNIDEDEVTNVWYKQRASGTYFSVETRKSKNDVDFDPTEAFRQAIEEYQIPNYSYKIDKLDNNKERCGIINLFDAHIDKISSIRDTDEESSIESNVALFEEAFEEILDYLSLKQPETIYFPIGNDFFHTNDFNLTTKRGTRQDDKVHTTDIEAFRIGLNLLRECIDKARSIAPVTIIPVRGNHDEDRVRYLLECLLVAYENQEDVNIIDSHKPRLYVRYGTWLFGWAHGDERSIKIKDYPQLMSTDKDARVHWSSIKQGVYFIGHVHHEKRYEYMKGEDFRGCKVEVLRATSGTDSWHWFEGYTAIPKTAYAFVYDKDGKREQEHKVVI